MRFRYLGALALFAMSFVARGDILCSATAENIKGFNDDNVFSKEAVLDGVQGTQNGHVKLHSEAGYEFWLVSAATVNSNGKTQRSFYTELHLPTGLIVRSPSALNSDEKQARIELITYPQNSYLYDSMLLFTCMQY